MRLVNLAATLAVLAAPLAATTPASAQDSQAGMPSFSSDEELRRFLMPDGPDGGLAIALPPPPPPPPTPPPPPPPPPPGQAMAAAPPPVAAPAPGAPAAPDNPSITNNQIQGVDEGGIVKVSGDNLVILRRGRLHTVSTANGALTPVDSVDAFPPGVSARGDWYDEMLISGDLIVVVGFSYSRGGTEINRFRISPDGRLTYVDTHHLKSNDYYSSRNYASRLIGTTLVVYTPLFFGYGSDDPLEDMPGLSRWTPTQGQARFKRIAGGTETYIPAPLKAQGPDAIEAMHTVSRCDLAAAILACDATVVMGPSGRTFFVSQNAVYVWVASQWNYDREDDPGYLYRIPLDGGRPGAVQVRGMPVDQFSFNPNPAASRLDILVTSDSGGDEMWAPEFAGGRPALLRLPTSRFGDGSGQAPVSDYRWLPGGEYTAVSHNRFVGGHLLYGLTNYNAERTHDLVVAPVNDGPIVVFQQPFAVDRIEQVGSDALVVGGTEALTFTTVDLSGVGPSIGQRFEQPGSRQSESRSHAFFYRADSPDGSDGIAGLPVLRNVAPERPGDPWLSAADILFLRRQDRLFGDFGALTATPSGQPDDGCQASCVDWYGSARPIFLRGRVFALLGYELVEGDASGAAIREVRRVDFTPSAR